MPETPPQWTILSLLQETTPYFEKKGIPNPRLDAELLLAAVLEIGRIDLYTSHDKKVSEKNLARFKELIARRAEREPLQYILGETEFWGLKIKVTPDVLIPRPETELLVEKALQQAGDGLSGTDNRFCSDAAKSLSALSARLKPEGFCESGLRELPSNPSPAWRILDIGTGSGCIAIALAKNLPRSKITATDISAKALELARGNARRNRVENQIEWIKTDLFPTRKGGTSPAPTPLYDLIISNPPYIAETEFAGLQPEVRDYEPREALLGGRDGLAIIRRILAKAASYLKPEGVLILEIGEKQKESLQREQQNWSFSKMTFLKDYQGIDRILIAKR
ncbi:MAG: peptide chain release factor N(5)-glutamine methyltransferase [Deltaproteobacteria bacterium]|nr:peptide chain release factor N(5)-glutamine methyltransferase [Deltaproteobacteria bacterium]